MKTNQQILPLHPSGSPDAITGWAHLLRLWYKIVIEMIGATVVGWERGDGFDLLLFEGYEDKTRGLNVKRAALNEWIASLKAPPKFDEFLTWIRTQEGNLLDDNAACNQWNAFASGYEFDADTIKGMETEYGLDLSGLTHAALINPLIDAAVFHKMSVSPPELAES